MSFIVESKQSARPLPPFGTQLARLIQIIDLGTHKTEATNDKTGAKEMRDRHTVRFVWELPNRKAVFRDGGPEEPFVVGRNLTLSLDKKATLSAVVEGIIGRSLTDSERKSFDISRLLGEACLLTIASHTKADGGASYKVGATAPPMEGVTVPNAANPLVLYKTSDGRNEVFNSFPDWLKEEINGCKEFASA